MIETAGWIALALAAFIAVTNYYLSALRYWVCRLLGRPYYSVSGIPGIGTILALVALVCLWHQPSAVVAVGICAAIDTAGLPWFVFMMMVMSVYDRRPKWLPLALYAVGLLSGLLTMVLPTE